MIQNNATSIIKLLTKANDTLVTEEKCISTRKRKMFRSRMTNGLEKVQINKNAGSKQEEIKHKY